MMEPTKHLLLASESPRRREITTWLNIPFQVTRVDVDEMPLANELPCELATRLALAKAQAVAIKEENIWILAADTIVDCHHKALGKPTDAPQAKSMLLQLREGIHQVHTGLAVVHPETNVLLTRRVTTDVWMRPYSDIEIDAYIATGDPMDKAGAYAIQHKGFHPVLRLDRCYANVVGLPLCAMVEMLISAGFIMAIDIPKLCLLHFNYPCPGPDKGTQV